jgi:hypothetical protein
MGTASSTGADSSGAREAPTEPSETKPETEPTVTEPTFVDGPAITPTPDLAAWLGKNKGNLLRLPLVIEVEPFGVGPAWIGMTADDAPADAIRIELDQGAMSVGLTDPLVALCKDTSTRCVAWIQGYWGPTMDMPGPGGPSMPDMPKEEPFSVREVVGLVQKGDTPHVKVVKD